MKKSKVLVLGMLALALVFGMTVVGCGGEEDAGGMDFLDTYKFSSGNPSAAALDAVGLTQAQFGQINTAAGGGYKGWELDEAEDEWDSDRLTAAWTGRSKSNFDSVISALEAIYGKGESEENGGAIYVSADSYSVQFYPTKLSDGSMYVSAGTLIVDFYFMDF